MKVKYCELAQNVCPNGIENTYESEKIFSAYSSHEELILNEINAAIFRLNTITKLKWISWQSDLDIENNCIFCEICKNILQSKGILVELSDLNFNVIFEYGYSLGLNKKIYPIVNSRFDLKNIERFFRPLLGIGIGKYEKNHLADKILKKRFWEKEKSANVYSFSEEDILSDNTNVRSNCVLFLKNVDDSVISEQIENSLSDYPFDYIIDDPQEEKNILAWYSKQIKKSFAVIIDLGMANYSDNFEHFLKCSFIAGICVGTGRRTLLLNSSKRDKPSDIITIIRSYSSPKEIKKIVTKFINDHSTSLALINSYIRSTNLKKETIFDNLDIGEHVAENDSHLLKRCYIQTPEFSQIDRQGYKIIIGRKGTGKSAAFYAHRENKTRKKDLVVQLYLSQYNLNDIYDLAIKFTAENEQAKIVASFWRYLLLTNVLRSVKDYILVKESHYNTNINLDNDFLDFYERFELNNNEGSFSEYFVNLIQKIVKDGITEVREIQRIFYSDEIIKLRDEIINYLKNEDLILYINIDGLDNNLSIQRNLNILSLILYNLHEVCLNLIGNRLDKYSINLFIRSDLFAFFKDDITQKDKITKIHLNWNKEDLFRLINERLLENKISDFTTLLSDEFNFAIFDKKFSTYIYNRPRDFMFFFNTLIGTAKSYKYNTINSKVFNDALESYAVYVNDSFEAEFLSLPFSFSFVNFMSDIKSLNNDKEKIPLTILYEILEKQNLSEEQIYEFLLKILTIEFICIFENKSKVDWSSLLNPNIKLADIINSRFPERVYFNLHPIIQKLVEIYY